MIKKMGKLAGALLLLTTMNVCAQVSENKTTLVFKTSGDKQCLNVGRTLEQSRQELVDKGIKADKGFCADRQDKVYPMVCGAGTPHIHLFNIATTQVETAKEIGYTPIDKVPYKEAKCRTTKPAGNNTM